MPDYLFRGSLAKLDPDVHELTQLEAERQARKLILIASESTAPMATREALASAFQNIYAEGYPDEESRWMTEEEILDYPMRLAHYRRDATRVTTRASSTRMWSRRWPAAARPRPLPQMDILLTISLSMCRRSRADPPTMRSITPWLIWAVRSWA
jgi:hypothetical protein